MDATENSDITNVDYMTKICLSYLEYEIVEQGIDIFDVKSRIVSLFFLHLKFNCIH